MMIGSRQVGGHAPCFVIAEGGVNHNGDLDLGLRLVDIAAAAGADAVKFQTFRTEEIITGSAPKAEYQLRTTGDTSTQFEMLKRLELTNEMHDALLDRARMRQITFLSTAFDEGSVELLESRGVPAFKVPSGEINNLPLLRQIARKGKPVILSTGMATLGEIDRAIGEICATGNDQLVLLHCVSEYPTPPHAVNLRAMETLATAFGFPVGLSDHTEGVEVALAAVALGAKVIEKHFTFDRNAPGPDHQASLSEDQLAALVRGVRVVTSALGDGRKKPTDAELMTAAVARKSLVARHAIPAGAPLTPDLVAIKRPGTGLPPWTIDLILGLRAVRDIQADALLQMDMFG